MKAFLSHSSDDKEFIEEIAIQLGRANCIFDKYSFEVGIEFSASIVEHLTKSSIFVFFASNKSVESLWCNYEQEEAFHLKLKKQIDHSIVFIIQDGVSLDNIPDWLKKSLIKYEKSPAIIAREIHHQIIKSSDKYQSSLFFGRSKEREQLEDIITPIDGRKPPRCFALFGLPGIGRRALVKSSLTELLSLSRVIEVDVEAGDNANSLCVKIADKAESYSCQNELNDKVAEIKALAEYDALERILVNLEKLVLSGELPLFVDAGGCLNDNGTFKKYINSLLSRIHTYRKSYLVFILPRRVNRENEFEIECLPVEPLNKKSIGQILSKLANDHYNITMEKSQIDDISDYINGYPPSAYYAAKESSIYGVASLISDKRKLTQFSKKKFISLIKDQNLSNDDKTILKLLSSYSPLPLEALIALYNNLDTSIIHDKIYELIDSSLIRVVEGQYYFISDPIKGSVREVLGNNTKEELDKVASVLESYIRRNDGFSDAKLDFSRVLFRMYFFLGRKDSNGLAIELKGDLIKLLEQYYHQQDYKTAVSLGRKTIEECPDDSRAKNFFIKALIQEELWDEAENQINNLYPIDEYRNIYYLKGFLERKRSRFDDAIKAFEDAKKYGRKGIGIYRELAHCYMMLDNYEMAKENIQKALSMQSDNSHILDMAAKLEIKHGNKSEALIYLDKLEILDVPKYFHMRKSSCLLKFGSQFDALEQAKKSIETGGNNFFSGRVQLVKTLILTKNYQAAKDEIRKLNNDFSGKKIDVKVALECSLAYAQGEGILGLRIIEKFTNTSSKQAKGFKKKFLNMLIQDVTIQYDKRKIYSSELSELSDTDDINIIDLE